MKTIYQKKQLNAAKIRESRLAALIAKYFDLFCSSFEYEGITRDKFRKIMAAFWTRGALIAVKAKGTERISDALGEQDNALMGICDYAPISWNLDGAPLEVTCLISSIGLIGGPAVDASNVFNAESKLLPIGKVLRNGKDCVVGYALQSHQPIERYVRQVINYILDAEVTIRNNQIAMGLQTTIVTNKDDQIRADDLQDQILGGYPIKVITSKLADQILFPASGISDFTDGEYKLKINYENELKTYLGIRNIGNIEKKERVNTEEAASNNEETDIGGDGIGMMIETFCADCRDVLGFDFSIRRKEMKEEPEENSGEDQGDDEDADR